MPLTGGDATHGYKQRATLDALGVRVVEMKVSAANDNARDAKVRGLDTAEHKRGGATGWRRSRAAAVGSGVGRTAEGNAALGEDSRELGSDCRRRAGDPRPGGPRAGVGRGDAALRRLLRCRAALGRQDDQARVVSATMDEPGLLGIVERLFEGQTRKADITADAFSPPPVERSTAWSLWKRFVLRGIRARRST